jgi:hypothetical protein
MAIDVNCRITAKASGANEAMINKRKNVISRENDSKDRNIQCAQTWLNPRELPDREDN